MSIEVGSVVPCELHFSPIVHCFVVRTQPRLIKEVSVAAEALLHFVALKHALGEVLVLGPGAPDARHIAAQEGINAEVDEAEVEKPGATDWTPEQA